MALPLLCGGSGIGRWDCPRNFGYSSANNRVGQRYRGLRRGRVVRVMQPRARAQWPNTSPLAPPFALRAEKAGRQAPCDRIRRDRRFGSTWQQNRPAV